MSTEYNMGTERMGICCTHSLPSSVCEPDIRSPLLHCRSCTAKTPEIADLQLCPIL